MTTLPVWPHHPYGLSKLAPAQDQLPFAQHFPRASFAEDGACGGQSVSLRQPSWRADQTWPSTSQPYVSCQAQSSEQQARVDQNVGRGATAKFVKGLEHAWRAPSSDDTSASTQLGSPLPSSEPQQLEPGSGHLTQRAEPNLLFPVSLQQIRAEAAAAQTIAHTWAQATDSGLPQRCFSEIYPQPSAAPAAQPCGSSEAACPMPIRPQALTVTGSASWHQKCMAGQQPFSKGLPEWQSTDTERNAGGSATTDERDQPRLIPRKGQGPRLRDKGGQHIDQYLMRLLRVGVKNAAEASLLRDEEGARALFKSRRKASQSASPRNPGNSFCPGGPQAEHQAVPASLHAPEISLQLPEQPQGHLPSAARDDQPHEVSAGLACKAFNAHSTDSDPEGASNGREKQQQQRRRSFPEPDAKLADEAGGSSAVSYSCSRLRKALGGAAFSSIRQLIQAQQQQFSSQVTALHRLVHVQRQLAPAPPTAPPGSSPLSSAGLGASQPSEPTAISSLNVVTTWDQGRALQPSPSIHHLDVQHPGLEAASTLQPHHANPQQHPRLMPPGMEVITLRPAQVASAANRPASCPEGTQLLGAPSGYASLSMQHLGAMPSRHVSSMTAVAWQQAAARQQAAAQPGATHGFQQEGLGAPALVGPSLPPIIHRLSRPPWPQLAPWPLQQPLQQGPSRRAGPQAGPTGAWPCNSPCDPMAAWYWNHSRNRPGFTSPLPLGPAATGDFLTGAIPLGKPCAAQPGTTSARGDIEGSRANRAFSNPSCRAGPALVSHPEAHRRSSAPSGLGLGART